MNVVKVLPFTDTRLEHKYLYITHISIYYIYAFNCHNY